MASTTELDAMRLALDLAATAGVPLGPNPRVGAVILDDRGRIVGRGFHRGAGSAHAEVAALAEAGSEARGGVAVVTLEPCNHHGLTGPCSRALLDAQVARVVYAQSDSSSLAAGGADFLAAHGVDTEGQVFAKKAKGLNPQWTFAHENRRPWLTYKFAATLDGRIAAPDGSSQWITGEDARHDVHRLRGQVDGVMVGTGTVLRDDPHLTVRDIDGVARQPKRVVVGERDLPAGARAFDAAAESVHLRTRDVRHVMTTLYQQDMQWVLLEGGPTLAGAFFAAGVVDEVVAYLAPALLGAGQAAVQIPGVETLADITRLGTSAIERVGTDFKISAQIARG